MEQFIKEYKKGDRVKVKHDVEQTGEIVGVLDMDSYEVLLFEGDYVDNDNGSIVIFGSDDFF